MSSSSDESSDSMSLTPPDIQQEAKTVIEDLLPTNSKKKYILAYEKFAQWKIDRKAKSLSENVFLAYFSDLSKKMKPTSLWSMFSMLKTTVLMKHNVNIKTYHNLMGMLKKKSDGYKCKKSRVLTVQNVVKFIKEAPDSKYLAVKVALIFGIYGACRCTEITDITINDIETHNNVMKITLRDTETKTQRTFVVRDAPLAVVQKYEAVRPVDVKTNRFFLNYSNYKCTKQVIGRHKIARMPNMIATYLKLSNPEEYTGHCFRRSSASLLADTGAILNKSKITNQISKSTNFKPTTSHQEAYTSVQELRESSTPGEMAIHDEQMMQQSKYPA